MTIREEIVTKVQNLPESVLPEVYKFVENIKEKDENLGLLRRLQKIKIEAPPDFAENLDLYTSGEKNFEENLR